MGEKTAKRQDLVFALSNSFDNFGLRLSIVPSSLHGKPLTFQDPRKWVWVSCGTSTCEEYASCLPCLLRCSGLRAPACIRQTRLLPASSSCRCSPNRISLLLASTL